MVEATGHSNPPVAVITSVWAEKGRRPGGFPFMHSCSTTNWWIHHLIICAVEGCGTYQSFLRTLALFVNFLPGTNRPSFRLLKCYYHFTQISFDREGTHHIAWGMPPSTDLDFGCWNLTKPPSFQRPHVGACYANSGVQIWHDFFQPFNDGSFTVLDLNLNCKYTLSQNTQLANIDPEGHNLGIWHNCQVYITDKFISINSNPFQIFLGWSTNHWLIIASQHL